MENRYKTDEQFKEAAHKAEDKGFDRMEAVWNRVEEKLDRKKERRAAAWWKYSGIAAILVLFIGIGTFMFMDENNNVAPQTVPDNTITTIDTARIKEVRDAIKEGIVREEVVVDKPVKFNNNSPADKASISPEKTVNVAVNTIADNVYSVTIVDEQGIPIPGATVSIQGSNEYAHADFDGKFTIKASKGDILKISFVGIEDALVEVKDSKNLEISMVSSTFVDTYRTTTTAKSAAAVTTLSIENIKDRAKANILPSVQGQVAGINIATGGGEPVNTKRTFRDGDRPATAIGYLSEENTEGHDYNYWPGNNNEKNEKIEAIEDRANASVLQNLQGQVAGLNIATGSGQPEADSTIILRGTGTINGNIEPLFVIDGIPVDEDAFRTISQDDIADIKILKDAVATSIYGNRGANGVIVITTKGKNDEQGKQELKSDALSTKQDAPFVLLNGIVVSKREIKKLDSNNIESILIVDDETASRLYGKDAENGVLIIKTKDRTEAEDKAIKKVVRKLEYQGQNTYQEIRYTPERIGIDTEEYESFIENQFENPATTPLSTFSIDVDNASYTNIRRFLNNGQTVPKDAVRVEEMINFFKYQYPQPKGNEPFSINTEYSDAPWNPKHKLLKIGLQGKEIPTAKLPSSNFVFLIDVSGSMESENKLPLLKQSMKLLVKQMRKEDRIAIVVYAGAAGLVLPSTSGAEKDKIIAALENLSAGGSTAGGAGIELAYKTAQENFVKGGNNRVIIATDGDFNVDASSNTDMQTLIEEKRKSGVFLTCMGYGMGNYKDSKLETLADKGNGNYAYIDNMQEADRFLQKEFKGSMYAIAKDVKIQIEFNPKHVQSYRLIGYENRKLRDEDFVNDAIDAGELGSGHTVTALYEIIPVGVKSDYFTAAPELKYSTPNTATGNYSDELATIKFRHKKPDEDISKETVKVIPNNNVPLQKASADFKFSSAVAWFGLKLRDSKLVPNKETDDIKELAREALANHPEGYRAEFIRLVDMVQ